MSEVAEHNVVGVRTDTINLPEPHEHAILLLTEDGREWAPGEVIEAIDDGTRFVVAVQADDGEDGGLVGPVPDEPPEWVQLGTIHYHPCPVCGSENYLCGGGQL